MRDKAIEAAGITGNEVTAESPVYAVMKKQVEATAWKLAPELRQSFPESWMHKSTRARVLLAKGGQVDPQSGKYDRYISISISTPDSAPLKLPTRAGSYIDEIYVEREDMSEEILLWVDQADARSRKRAAITSQYIDIRQKVDAFLDSVSSLNAALKAMPELELYVPEKYLSRWREATAPKQAPAKPKIPDGLDRESLASLGIAHRIMTSSDDS